MRGRGQGFAGRGGFGRGGGAQHYQQQQQQQRAVSPLPGNLPKGPRSMLAPPTGPRRG